MSDNLQRSCWYALFLSIVKNKEADESLKLMGILKEGKADENLRTI